MKFKTFDEWRKEKGKKIYKRTEESNDSLSLSSSIYDDPIDDCPKEDEWKPLTGPRENIYGRVEDGNISPVKERTEANMMFSCGTIFPENDLSQLKSEGQIKEYEKLTKLAINPKDLSPQQHHYACNGIINLDKKQWLGMKGVGVKLADRLVENGPYLNQDELAKVKGVGKGVLEQVTALLVPTIP